MPDFRLAGDKTGALIKRHISGEFIRGFGKVAHTPGILRLSQPNKKQPGSVATRNSSKFPWPFSAYEIIYGGLKNVVRPRTRHKKGTRK